MNKTELINFFAAKAEKTRMEEICSGHFGRDFRSFRSIFLRQMSFLSMRN